MRPVLLLLFTSASYIGFSQPAASFIASRHKVCSGSMVQLSNTSTGANSYQWFVNGSLVSTVASCNIIININDGIYQPVMLIAQNTAGGQPDTAQTVLEAIGTVAMHLTGDFTACVGDTIKLRAHPDAVANLWTIDPPHQPIAGCLGCDSVHFVLEEIGTTVDLNSGYDGGCSQKTSFHYAWCNPMHIAETKRVQSRVYPNPARDIVFIEPTATAVLYNTIGQVIKTCVHPVQQIYTGDLPAGVYYLQLWIGTDATETIKLVKE